VIDSLASRSRKRSLATLETVAFWVAVCSPLALLVVLASGLNSTGDVLRFLALVILATGSFVIGRPHDEDAVSQ